MKVHQLTFHCPLNYGAVLQAYALGRVLKNLGHEVSLVDLRPKRLAPEFTLHPLGLLHRWKFHQFVRRFCAPLTATARWPGQAAKMAAGAEAWVVGSDQVWNPEITGVYADDYFLAQLAPGCRRVAYAASFGVTELTWPEELRKRVRYELSRFDGISVREDSGLRLCAELGVTAVEQTLDPTLLLNDFRELLPAHPRTRKDLLCMIFQPGPSFGSAVQALARQLELSPLLLARRAGGTGFRNLPHPGVTRWVRCFREASFVLTDSFHGLAFALLFNKPFAVVPANRERFFRIRELLAQLGLESRIFDSYAELQASTRWQEPIPYDEINQRLAARRQVSLAFLNRHLGPRTEAARP